MKVTRRQVLAAGGAMAAIVAEPCVLALTGQNKAPNPQPMPSKNAPTNLNAPIGLDGSGIPVTGESRQIAPATWTEIKSYAQKILDLATDFKWQVDRANVAATLPLLLLKEAHSLEKLAKQVQDRMKA